MQKENQTKPVSTEVLKEKVVQKTPEAAVEAKKPEVKLPELDDFLNAGTHFGHKSSRWNPKMAQYIFDERDGVHIIDLIQTMKLLSKALKAIQNSSDKGNILIVGTKGQASSIVKDMCTEVGALYIDQRWPGGLFTNFSVIKKSLDKLMKMEEYLAKGAQGSVKKEQILMARDIQRLNSLYSGIKFMDKLPELVVVIDSRVEKNAINEAKKAKVPIVALVDTNCDPSLIDYPIPANDDSIRSLKLLIGLMGEAVKGGRKADALKSLRRDYSAQLEKTKNDFENEVKLKKSMQEADIERIKSLRKGEIVASKVKTSKEKIVRIGK